MNQNFEDTKGLVNLATTFTKRMLDQMRADGRSPIARGTDILWDLREAMVNLGTAAAVNQNPEVIQMAALRLASNCFLMFQRMELRKPEAEGGSDVNYEDIEERLRKP